MDLLEILETDEKGETMSNLYPTVNRKYYLKEVKTTDGYSFTSDLLKVTLIGNSIRDVVIKNSKVPRETDNVVIEEKETKPEIVTKEPEVITTVEEPEPITKVIMGEPKIIKEVAKLPKTGM